MGDEPAILELPEPRNRARRLSRLVLLAGLLTVLISLVLFRLGLPTSGLVILGLVISVAGAWIWVNETQAATAYRHSLKNFERRRYFSGQGKATRGAYGSDGTGHVTGYGGGAADCGDGGAGGGSGGDC